MLWIHKGYFVVKKLVCSYYSFLVYKFLYLLKYLIKTKRTNYLPLMSFSVSKIMDTYDKCPEIWLKGLECYYFIYILVLYFSIFFFLYFTNKNVINIKANVLRYDLKKWNAITLFYTMSLCLSFYLFYQLRSPAKSFTVVIKIIIWFQLKYISNLV